MRVLLAEDDATSRRLLAHILQSWGYEVTPAEDGRRAWEALARPDSPPMAILDWEMPELDGVEVCRLVRAVETASPPYLILLTARTAKEDIVTGLDAGADDFLTKPFHREELRARVEVGRRFVELNQELVDSREQLRLLALTDMLTGAMNRRAVMEDLERAALRAARSGEDLAIGMMDVDFFKRINDTWGHAAGDEVLKEVVRRSAGALRSADYLGRFGGEEFLLILAGASARSARSALERVREAVAATPMVLDEGSVDVAVSIGGAVWNGDSVDRLIIAADDALYAAKDRGRNLVVMAAPGGEAPQTPAQVGEASAVVTSRPGAPGSP
jgi:two-component system, cell cycle response regulator